MNITTTDYLVLALVVCIAAPVLHLLWRRPKPSPEARRRIKAVESPTERLRAPASSGEQVHDDR